VLSSIRPFYYDEDLNEDDIDNYITDHFQLQSIKTIKEKLVTMIRESDKQTRNSLKEKLEVMKTNINNILKLLHNYIIILIIL